MGGTGKGRSSSSIRGKVPSASRYDLGVPGLVADCVNDIYALTGAKAVPFDRLSTAILFFSILIGFFLGYEPGHKVPGEFLYGPIGAALGTVFGFVLGGATAAFTHLALAPWLRPEAHAIKLIRMGRIRSASAAMRRARLIAVRRDGALWRIVEAILRVIGVARWDVPRDIALANISSVEGVLAEAVGDNAAASEAYLRALAEWSRHGFAMASLLDLVYREKMWETVPEVAVAGGKFLEQTRDKTFGKAVAEYLDLIAETPEKAGEPLDTIKESQEYYTRTVAPEAMTSCRLIENPGSQISNGLLIVKSGGSEKTVRLPPMPFRLVMILAETLKSCPADADPAQAGWVSVTDLLADLPWTTPNITNSNVHKLVYKTRNHLAQNDLGRNFIEENDNGCYRLALKPDSIEIQKVEE